MSTDVFIIGGGPAGLAAALAARRKGFDVTVADGGHPPIDKACGEGLMPDGLSALRELGVTLDDAGAQPFCGIRFVGAGVSVASRFAEGYALGVRRTVLHTRMVEAAAEAGVHMLWDTPVNDIPAGIAARWVIGADGFHSRVRQRIIPVQQSPGKLRFGFRIHFQVAPWTEYMELHWGPGCQIYVTPISAQEVCAAVISRDPHLRLEDALSLFPQLSRKLAGAPQATLERGSVTRNRRLECVYRGNVALVGDASGSVDAISGEGLCLAFRQAIALADSLAAGDLALYQRAHRRLARRPMFISRVMLAMDRRDWLRGIAFRAMAAQPRIFESVLSYHLCAPNCF